MATTSFWASLACLPLLAASQALSKVLSSESAFSSFYKVLDHHDLLADLDSERNVTWFAPNNDAIQYLSDFGINLTTADPSITKALLAYGMIDGIHTSRRLTAFGQARRFVSHLHPPLFTNVTDGQSVKIRVKQKQDDLVIALETGLQILTQVVQQDIAFDHGILHGTSTNMVLPENISDTTTQSHMTGFFELMQRSGTETRLNDIADATFFVPSNRAIAKIRPLLNMLTPKQLATVVLQHVTAGRVLYEDMVNQRGLLLKGLSKNTIKIDRDNRGELRIEGFVAQEEDVLLHNGVAHLIDGVLLPSDLESIQNLESIQSITDSASLKGSYQLMSEWFRRRLTDPITFAGVAFSMLLMTYILNRMRQRRSSNYQPVGELGKWQDKL